MRIIFLEMRLKFLINNDKQPVNILIEKYKTSFKKARF